MRLIGERAAVLLAAMATSSMAQADPIPAPVTAMIAAAAADPAALKTVANLTRKTNPGSGAEIDALVADFGAKAWAAHTANLASQAF